MLELLLLLMMMISPAILHPELPHFPPMHNDSQVIVVLYILMFHF
jgi:hypothetical protein